MSRRVKHSILLVVLLQLLLAIVLLAFLMDAFSPLHSRLRGSYLNRGTVETVAQSGLLLERVEALDELGIFNLIVAHTPQQPAVSLAADRAPAEELLREGA